MSRCFAAIDSAVTARRFGFSPVSLTFGIFVCSSILPDFTFGTHDGPGKDSKSLNLIGYHKERRNSQRKAWHRIRTEKRISVRQFQVVADSHGKPEAERVIHAEITERIEFRERRYQDFGPYSASPAMT
jgi:hypothetical protein